MLEAVDFTAFSGYGVVRDGGVLEIFMFVRNVWKFFGVRVKYMMHMFVSMIW